MKVLLVGDWHSELHEEVVSNALQSLGHEVEEFRWCTYFSQRSYPFSFLWNLIQRAQNKFLIGPTIDKLNRDILNRASIFCPDFIFIYRGTHIKKSTLQAIKKTIPKCILVGYNNDDPFAPGHDRWLWRFFLDSIPKYDLMLAYRHSNIVEYEKAGAKRVELLRSWYVPERNHPVELSDTELNSFDADVVFIGHYEADQRLDYLEEIVRQGYKLRLFGPGYDWDSIVNKSTILRSLSPIQLVWGDDYNRALCGAKIALCFFSKLNRDTYTRRCFEIPATKTFLLSEYSDDLASLYAEGSEIEFFRDRDEMMEKIKFYLDNPKDRLVVASGGFRRVVADHHDVVSRMNDVIEIVNHIKLEFGNEF